MIKIKEIMFYIHEVLSNYGETYYKDAERERDGTIKLQDTFLVYNISGSYQFTDNKSRLSLPLEIDIWFKKGDLYDSLNIIKEIDDDLRDTIVNMEDSVFRITRDANYHQNIPEPDENIMRMRLTYNIDLYK